MEGDFLIFTQLWEWNRVITLDGRDILADGERIYLRGVSVWGNDVLYRTARLEADLAYIASLGFNTVQLMISWSKIEPEKTQPGAYREATLTAIEQVLTWAQQKNLYVFLGSRLASTNWTNDPGAYGWSYPDMMDPHYTPDWESWFNRFLDMWRYVIRRLDGHESLIGYNLDFFPWHGKDPETESWTSPKRKVDHYEYVMTPGLLQMLREETDKLYFYTPMGQGSWRHPEASRIAHLGHDAGEMPLDPVSSTGGYDPDYDRGMIDTGEPVSRPFNPAELGLITDGNVIYCSSAHRPLNVEWRKSGPTGQPPNWWASPLQMEYLHWQLEPMKKFIRKYNVPGILTEFGVFYYNRPMPIPQWIADCYDAKMKMVNQDPAINWTYWMFDDGNEGILMDRGVYELNRIGEVLIKYIEKNGGEQRGKVINKSEEVRTLNLVNREAITLQPGEEKEIPDFPGDIELT